MTGSIQINGGNRGLACRVLAQREPLGCCVTPPAVLFVFSDGAGQGPLVPSTMLCWQGVGGGGHPPFDIHRVMSHRFLGVTSCPPSRTPYTHDVRIFYISSLSMLFDICEQCWYQRCVTSIEMGGDVLALGIRFI